MIRSNKLTGIRALLVYGTISLLAVAGLAGCAAGSKGSASQDAHSAAAKATASAPAATNWLKANGYAPLPIPGFGHVEFGIKSTAPKYAAVYSTTGKDASLVNVIITDAKQKLASDGTTGVTITYVNNQIAVTAVSKADVKAAAKALLSAAKHPGGGA